MIESFKIISLELKRAVKFTIYLPNDYNISNNYYDPIFMLDGQDFFSDIYSKNSKMNLANTFDEAKLNNVVIAIHSPENPKWRLSEFVSYDLGEGYDNKLSIVFIDYLINHLVPLLKEKYRITNKHILFGFKESCILGINLLDYFKYVALISPVLLNKNKLTNKLETSSNNKIYIYSENNDEAITSSLFLSRILDSNKNINYLLEFKEENNSELDWKDYIIQAVKYFQE